MYFVLKEINDQYIVYLSVPLTNRIFFYKNEGKLNTYRLQSIHYAYVCSTSLIQHNIIEVNKQCNENGKFPVEECPQQSRCPFSPGDCHDSQVAVLMGPLGREYVHYLKVNKGYNMIVDKFSCVLLLHKSHYSVAYHKHFKF